MIALIFFKIQGNAYKRYAKYAFQIYFLILSVTFDILNSIKYFNIWAYNLNKLILSFAFLTDSKWNYYFSVSKETLKKWNKDSKELFNSTFFTF